VRSNGRGTLPEAFRFAGRGVLEAALSQRNMRLHLVAAVLVATFGSAFPLGVAEQLALLSSVFVVVAAEVLNTALEAAVDLAGDGPDERARLAKDAGAGFVLVLSVGAAVVFALVVARNWELLRSRWRDGGQALVLGLALASLSAWLVFPFRRPRWLDWLAFLGGSALLVPLALASRSLVFVAVAGLALAVCALAAFGRRSRATSERQEMLSPAAPPPRRPAG
jgi:diacylglycerol kinase (ATP)